MSNKKEKDKSAKIQERKIKQLGLEEKSEFGMCIRKMEESNILRKMSETNHRSRKVREAKLLALLSAKE